MNILYVGQYKDLTIAGLYSSLTLDHLVQKNSVTSRHIYTNGIPSNNNVLVFSENHICDQYDVIIQHLPINRLAYTQKLKKNIVIPVLGSKLLSPSDIEYLDLFDNVFVDNPMKKKYLDGILHNPVKLYSLPQDSMTEQMNRVITFPAYENSTKYYTIVEYAYNTEYIFDLTSEFIFNTIDKKNICLVIYLLNIDNVTLQALQKQVDDAQKLAGIDPENLSKVILMPISLQIIDIHTAHYSGDIFLNIHDYPKNNLHSQIAQIYGKNVINLTIDNICHSKLRNNIFSNSGFDIINKSKIKSILDISTIDESKLSLYPSLESII